MHDIALGSNGWRAAPLVGIALGLTVFVYPLALPIPLFDPDEGQHAAIAQEMVERGDWIVPRLLGEPFLDKPILYFWAQALSLRWFGMSEAAVRLPGLLFALLGAITTAILGARLLGRPVGWVAGLCYGTMILPMAMAQAPMHDVALVPWVNLSLLLFWQSHQVATRRARVACTLGIGLLLGLAILTKGLAGVALIGLAYGGFLLATRQLSMAACLRGAAALAIAVLIAALWYLPVEFRNPGYLKYYLFERHVLGFATSTQKHGDNPWWYYLPILVVGGLPWIAYLPALAVDARDRRRESPLPNGEETRGAMVLLWCWLLCGTLFLSVSHSKLVTYVWPIFPAVAILAAVVWVRACENALSHSARRLVGATVWLSCLTGPVVLPAAMAVLCKRLAIDFSCWTWMAGIVAALTAVLPLGLWHVGRWRPALFAILISLAIQFVLVMTLVMPRVADRASAQCLAEYFNQQDQLPNRILVADERIGSLVFYLTPALRAGLNNDRLQHLHMPTARSLPKPLAGAVMVLADQKLHRVIPYLDLSGIPCQRVGRYRIYEAADIDARLRRAHNAEAHGEPVR